LAREAVKQKRKEIVLAVEERVVTRAGNDSRKNEGRAASGRVSGVGSKAMEEKL